MTQCVLVVEDERKIRDVLRSYLEHDGLSVISTDSGAEAISLARSAGPDLVLLDLRLPDVPGEEVAREIRTFSTVPIVILTAKAEATDRIAGLELGADDYVTKPFSPREVVLRVRAILRRTDPGPQAGGAASFGAGLLSIDEPRHQVSVGGVPVELTATEWGLLTTLAGTPGRVFSRAELINRVRGYEFEGYERTIDTHVKNLRRKLDEHQSMIETVVGVGYRLALRPDQAASR
jgi:DNA-binding response OmpR family regulator